LSAEALTSGLEQANVGVENVSGIVLNTCTGVSVPAGKSNLQETIAALIAQPRLLTLTQRNRLVIV
jgi:predicted naringenin-chalcone synthase